MPLTIPKDFVCPITSKVMLNPCTASCSHTFEKDAVFGWLQITQDYCCPICSVSFVNQAPKLNHVLRRSIQRFFICTPKAIGLVEDSIQHAMFKQNILYGKINGSQNITPSSIHSDMNINAEWMKVLSSCLEENHELQLNLFNSAITSHSSQALAEYNSMAGFILQNTTQRNNSALYQSDSFTLSNNDRDSNISISLRQAREWYRNFIEIERRYLDSKRKTNKKLSCTVS